MAGIGYKATRVCKHTNEVCKHTKVCKGLHLRFHTVALIVEPPAGAKLDLTGGKVGLEASHHCAENVVILGIEGVKDGLRKCACTFKVGEALAEILCDTKVVYRVKACVCTKLFIHSLVIVTESANVELHRPIVSYVLLSTYLKHCGLEGVNLFLCKLVASHSLIEGSLCVALCEGNVLKGVVGEAAAVIVKVCDSLSHPSNKLVVGADLDGLDVGDEGFLVDFNSLIRTEGRKNLGGETNELLVVLKGICRIVCGANYFNVRTLDKLLCAELGLCKKLVTSIPDALAGFLIKNLVDIKVSLKLKVCPMIEGVADKERKSSCKLGELLIIVCTTCNAFLGNTV